MTSKLAVLAVVALALISSACIVQSSGPNENRAEVFEFIPVPVAQQEAVEAFRSMLGPGPETLDETTLVPLGKINTSAGPIVFAEFQMIDPQTGRGQCSGSAGPFGGGWGCGPLGQAAPEGLPLGDVVLSSTGSTGTWSEVEVRVSDDVAHLEAVADDGTTYRMEPIGGFAWMEWKTVHGEVRITAFDDSGVPLGSVETEAG